MKKHLSYIATWLLAALMFASCSDFEEFFTPEDKDCVTLTLTMGGENLMTRATQQIGDNTFNENTIDKIDIFLYPIGGTEQNAVYQKTISGINDNDSDGDKQHEVKTSISGSDINALFPNGATECVAFVIVNRPDNVTLTDTDIESLKNLELTCTSFTTLQPVDPDEPEGYKKVSIPDNFVMSGQNNVALNPQNRSITGEVEVYRSASKTTLEITNVVDKVQDENDANRWWHSDPDNIRIYFKNCKEKGHLNNIELDNWSDGKKTLKPIGMQEIAGQAGHYHYTSLTPLYSYATNWANNINNRASIIVVVPWAQGNEIAPTGNFTETYYEIPINDAEERLDRNTYYKLALEIGVVGSFQEEQPLEIRNCSYIILPWGTGHSDIEASLAAVRYLVVDEKAVVMNNIISYRINFSSSHPVEIREGSMILKRRDLTKSNATWNDQPQSTSNPGGLRIVNGVPDYFRVPLKSDETGTYMLIEHDLVNNMDKNSDYSDYYMEFIIQHTDNEAYSQKITVIQHPMIFAEAEKNSDAGNGTNPSNTHRGYTFLNAGIGNSTYYYNSTSSTSFLGGVSGISSNAANKNPNRYIVRATALTTDNFIIGDPRQRTVNNNLSNSTMNSTDAQPGVPSWTNLGATVYTEGKTATDGSYDLVFYHPTEESQRTAKMISPQFMVASSYGVCTTGIPKENARRRCASYQEDGYPAGRWRLPTSAEVQYIVQLSAWGQIPILFGSVESSNTWGQNSYYWTANGIMRVNSSNPDNKPEGDCGLYTGSVRTGSIYGQNNSYGNNSTYVQEGSGYYASYRGVSVRCVYDTWYWSDTCTKTQFTWGDKQDTSYWGQ